MYRAENGFSARYIQYLQPTWLKSKRGVLSHMTTQLVCCEITRLLKETCDLAVDKIYILGRRPFRQARHGHHLTTHRHHTTPPRRYTHLSHIQAPTTRPTPLLLVVGQGCLSLRHADGQISIPILSIALNRLLGLRSVVHAIRTVDLLRDRLNLFHYGLIQLIQELEVRVFFAHAYNLFRQSPAAFTTLGPYLREHDLGTHFTDLLIQEIQLLLSVVREAVDRNDHGDAKALDVLHVLLQVIQTLAQRIHVLCLQIFKLHSAVHLQSSHRSHKDHRIRHQAGVTALDVEELLCSKIRRKTGFSHRVVCELQSQPCGLRGVAAVRDIGERPAVHQGRSILQSLHQVRH